MARASTLQIPVTRQRRCKEARTVLAMLNSGGSLDPALVTLLRAALEPLGSEPIPEHLEDAAKWVGQPEAARSEALQGLLRVADQVARSRGPIRAGPRERFPRFSSEPAAASQS